MTPQTNAPAPAKAAHGRYGTAPLASYRRHSRAMPASHARERDLGSADRAGTGAVGILAVLTAAGYTIIGRTTRPREVFSGLGDLLQR